MSGPSLKDTIRAQSQDAYQRAILEAAEVVFAEHGFGGATMARVAREAGVSVGTVYNHFENKDHLFRSLMALRGNQLLVALDDLDLDSKPPLVHLRELVTTTLAYFDAHRATYSMFIEVGDTSEGAQHIAKSSEIHECFVERFVAAIARAQGAGELTAEVDAADLVALLTGSMKALIVRRARSRDPRPMVSCATLILDHFTRGAQA